MKILDSQNAIRMVLWGGNAYVNNKAFSGLRFIETGFAVVARAGWGKMRYADSFVQKSNNRNASLELTLGIGRGRLENLTDAQMAFYILNDLQNQKLLSNDFTAADMDGLAKTITNINNTRLLTTAANAGLSCSK